MRVIYSPHIRRVFFLHFTRFLPILPFLSQLSAPPFPLEMSANISQSSKLRISTKAGTVGPTIPIPCKYFLDGFCANGSRCRFQHVDSANKGKNKAHAKVSAPASSGIVAPVPHSTQHQPEDNYHTNKTGSNFENSISDNNNNPNKISLNINFENKYSTDDFISSSKYVDFKSAYSSLFQVSTSSKISDFSPHQQYESQTSSVLESKAPSASFVEHISIRNTSTFTYADALHSDSLLKQETLPSAIQHDHRHTESDPGNNRLQSNQAPPSSDVGLCYKNHTNCTNPVVDTDPKVASPSRSQPTKSSTRPVLWNDTLSRSRINTDPVAFADRIHQYELLYPQSSHSHNDVHKFSQGLRVRNLCIYHIEGSCKYGDSCKYVHGTTCPVCLKNILDPFDTKAADKHVDKCSGRIIEKQLDLEQQAKNVRIPECGICLENPLLHGRKIGILQLCSHIFCLECIREWRANMEQFGNLVRQCPVCRIESFLVIPSTKMIYDAKEKEELFASYRKRLATIPCRHYNFGQGTCPFSTSCLYAHINREGKRAVMELPRLCVSSDGQLKNVKTAATLGEFL